MSDSDALLPCNTVVNSPGTDLHNATGTDSSPSGTETHVDPLRSSNPTSLESNFESNRACARSKNILKSPSQEPSTEPTSEQDTTLTIKKKNLKLEQQNSMK